MDDLSPTVAGLREALAGEDRETRARRIATIALRSCGIAEEDLPAAVEEHWQDYAECLSAIQSKPASTIDMPAINWPT